MGLRLRIWNDMVCSQNCGYNWWVHVVAIIRILVHWGSYLGPFVSGE